MWLFDAITQASTSKIISSLIIDDSNIRLFIFSSYDCLHPLIIRKAILGLERNIMETEGVKYFLLMTQHQTHYQLPKQGHFTIKVIPVDYICSFLPSLVSSSDWISD